MYQHMFRQFPSNNEVGKKWKKNSQSSDNIPSNDCFDSPDQDVHDGHNPDDPPVPPLDQHRISGSDSIDADNVNDGPDQGEAPDVVRIVEI